MKSNIFHILNGDALKNQFPTDKIDGELIVARECLVDGPVESQTLDELFEVRSAFLEDYQDKVIPEISKITTIEDGEVYLWFEEDLFCQINLWFVCSLLYKKNIDVFLVLPKTNLEYGFGGLDAAGLVKAFGGTQAMTKINVNQFAILWFAYRKNNIERLLKLGVQLHGDFPFVMNAIGAHYERLPSGATPGKPHQLIADIISEKSPSDFGAIFREFHKRAPIYGYGDLQVRRIYDEVVSNL